ncbi:DUF4337 domain-containing protein [Bradyrhizobium sp. BWA-3-5]|uniref:DUF4337 domain-containing protein n=1 Tax=Bradyrhizobium sp. BWA-3-5 TaxID=3080013 RepID=UPI00293E2D4B|nr:DUF4337 domain-containing protein [Bradyrhizobium sp. BWA-3-5]WOH63838.1 DUF4337 domain-containing protein [Bradyrhizobium sp. BWA-3-5]
MSAHESMKHAEHAEHAAGENKKIALLIAMLALFLAISETLGKSAHTEANREHIKAASDWAFFQAKKMRGTVVQTAAELTKLIQRSETDEAIKAAMQKQIEDWEKSVARSASEPETGEGTAQFSARAKHAEHERDKAAAKYYHFELASAAFQIGIVLASTTVITGMLALAYVSGVLTLVGIGVTALGVWWPHILHLH